MLNLTNRDRKLILIAGVLFLIVLAVRVLPLINERFQQGRAEIGRLEDQIERFQRLVEEESLLAFREADMLDKIEELASWTFQGSTESLIGSSVQQELRQAVADADVNVREMSVAEFSKSSDWVLVSQEMTFTIQQTDIIEFLNLLANSTPRLHIAEFSITRTRRQFNGSLTVVGFSRTLENGN